MTALEQYLIDENKDMQKRLAEAYRELGFTQGKLMCIYQRYPPPPLHGHHQGRQI